jgi:pyridoxal phosphate enzyme (YggS family)
VTIITEKLAALRERVHQAARAAHREPQSVTIVAVSKAHPRATVEAAWHAGLRDFGENYLQEALPKVTELTDATWHFIGSVQANKTRALAENFRWVQTVTTLRIAERLSRQRPFYAGDLQVCLQLQPEPARERGGVAAAEVAALAGAVAGLPRLRLRGLMFMPSFDLTAAALAAEFRRACSVFDSLRSVHPDIDTLSMGMSADLEAAIGAGSTMVRVGTALFGERS